jgi:DNA-binding transcriptional regulator YiaG
MKKTVASLMARTGRTTTAAAVQKDILRTVFRNNSGAFSIKEFANRYQISYEALTRMTGFSLRAISNWSQGSKPSSSTAMRLTEIKRLFAALENLVSPEAIGSWLKEPNPAFDGSTPLQVIERGESDRIWRMVYELESGEPA